MSEGAFLLQLKARRFVSACAFMAMAMMMMAWSCHAAAADAAPSSPNDDGPVLLTGLTVRLEANTRSNSWNGDSDLVATATPVAPGDLRMDQATVGVSYGSATSRVSVEVGAASLTAGSLGQAGAPLAQRPANTGAATHQSLDPWLASYSIPGRGVYGSGAMPSVRLAYRHDFDRHLRLNMEATRASAFSQDAQQSLSATRIGFEYTPARNSAVGIERATVSLKMSGSFSLRIKRGGPMLYMRTRF